MSFEDLFTTKPDNCYCMAICMYVVALVNCISSAEGEEMNKVTDAINRTRCPSLRQPAPLWRQLSRSVQRFTEDNVFERGSAEGTW